MAKGIRINKNKTFSQKQFHKHKRIQKKQKKNSKLATKKIIAAATPEDATVKKQIKLSTRQRKIMLREAKRIERANTVMEVAVETKKKQQENVQVQLKDEMDVE